MIKTDDKIYADCMAEVRQRLDTIKWTVAGCRVAQHEPFFSIELIFLQFRKVLELIAFASLTANREKYSAAHANFSSHWHAKRMLDDIHKLNPGFYPEPFEAPVTIAAGRQHFDRPTDGFLTKDEFVTLYDKCGEFMHARNPFTQKDAVTQIGYTVDDWVNRIHKLVRWHSVELANGTRWVANVPDTGDVHLFTAAPNN
jgi:hypothetical protein